MPNWREYFYDPYGNVIKVLDGSGNAVDINNETGFNNAYTYRGYRYDPESGLYFLNARYYAAGIGRFLTKDTFKGDATDTRSLNRYAYCEGDPVDFSDPSGNVMMGNNGERAIVKKDGTYVITDDGNSTGSTISMNRSTPQCIPSHTTPARSLSQIDDSPDYTAYTIGAGEIVGLGVTYTVDRDNKHYIGVHTDIGKTYAIVSGSVMDGIVANKTSYQQVPSYLTGWGRNYSAGWVAGTGLGESVYSDLRSAEVGGMIPQFGSSQGYTWKLPW